MVQLYRVADDGSTEALHQVLCKNEDKELQRLLARNPDLLPGDQINPDDPRRWLIIEREMPVPDPNTGENRWNIDFLMADQDAIPTFVEVKRFGDTRSRREVIGQMFEYAANGHYYWTKDQMRELAEQTAESRGSTLDDQLSALAPNDIEGIDAFFEKFQENLREGQLRLVFFLEKSPLELRSLVDFLNRQMERSEVLLVEAQMFERDGARFVVPSLFGYSEEARRVKRVVTISTRKKRKWDKESFFEKLVQQTDTATVAAVQKLYDFALSQPYDIRWGKGPRTGTMGFLILHAVSAPSVLLVDTNGRLSFAFRRLGESYQIADALHQLAVDKWGLEIQDEYHEKYPNFASNKWINNVDAILDGCRQLVDEFS